MNEPSVTDVLNSDTFWDHVNAWLCFAYGYRPELSFENRTAEFAWNLQEIFGVEVYYNYNNSSFALRLSHDTWDEDIVVSPDIDTDTLNNSRWVKVTPIGLVALVEKDA